MSQISISLQEVADTASKIRALNEAMNEELLQIKNLMNSLDGYWLSDSADEIRSRFNMFAMRFQTQKQTIESYAGFLDLAVESYDSLESSITGNASGMQY